MSSVIQEPIPFFSLKPVDTTPVDRSRGVQKVFRFLLDIFSSRQNFVDTTLWVNFYMEKTGVSKPWFLRARFFKAKIQINGRDQVIWINKNSFQKRLRLTRAEMRQCERIANGSANFKGFIDEKLKSLVGRTCNIAKENLGRSKLELEDGTKTKHSVVVLDGERDSKLGEGGFKTVFHAIDGHTKKWVALLRTKTEHPNSPYTSLKVIAEAKNEALTLKKLNEIEGVLHIISCREDKGKFEIETELCSSDLFEKISEKYDFKKRLKWALEAAQALKEVHKQGIIHGDVKSENFLVRYDEHVCLADFGAAYDIGNSNKDNSNRGGGTDEFLSPERLLAEQKSCGSSKKTKEADVWAFGLTLLLLFQKDPVTIDITECAANREVVVKKILEEIRLVPNKRIQYLLKSMLTYESFSRCEMNAVFNALSEIQTDLELHPENFTLHSPHFL